MKAFDVVICGAGIAGIATGHYLATKHGVKRIALVDKLLPMSLTTSKSGENFRDYWPQACMASFAGHSLDLMKTLATESDNAFDIRFFGYEFVSESVDSEIFPSEHLRERGSGLRQIRDSGTIRRQYPHLADSIQQVVHIERAGAFDVYALGSLLLSRARSAGLTFIQGTVTSLRRRVGGFTVQVQDERGGTSIEAPRLVLAAGPFVGELAEMLDVTLPVRSFAQRKILIPDPQAVIPRDMPFTIFADAQTLRWSDEERALMAAEPAYRWLLDGFPAGLHIKPESQDQIKLGWAYNRVAETPRWQLADDLEFANIVLRGASRFIPALEQYVDRVPTPVVQYAGYYTRTPENWPLIGPLAEGLFTVAALSGYGTMCACAAGELCADWMAGSDLPDYARNFHPDRYQDPTLVAEMDALESDGQL